MKSKSVGFPSLRPNAQNGCAQEAKRERCRRGTKPRGRFRDDRRAVDKGFLPGAEPY